MRWSRPTSSTTTAPDGRSPTAPAARAPTRSSPCSAPPPDLHAVIHDQLGEGDKVTTRKTLHGTHRGPFWGVPPTGKQVTIDLIDSFRITDGQMVEHCNLVDWMGLMQQLQATPAPGTTSQ